MPSDRHPPQSPSYHRVHLNLADLEALLNRAGDPLVAHLFLHQLATCPECYRRAGEVLDLHRGGWLSEHDLTRPGLALARSRRAAPELLQQLESWPFLERMERLRRGVSFHSWGLAELLCQRSLSASAQEPQEALELAFLAEETARSARCSELPSSAQQELRMLAAAHVGNTLRLVGHGAAAHDVFEAAESQWAAVVEPALPYRPWVLSLRASLEIDDGRLHRALEYLRDAERLLLAEGTPRWAEGEERQLQARLRLQEARIRGLQGRRQLALRLEAQARTHLDSAGRSRDGRLEIEARLLQASTLADLGQLDEALASLSASAPWHPMDDLRRRWLEARISRALGNGSRAADALEAVRGGFLERRLLSAAGTVTLELVELLLELGRSDRAQLLAADTAHRLGQGAARGQAPLLPMAL